MRRVMDGQVREISAYFGREMCCVFMEAEKGATQTVTLCVVFVIAARSEGGAPELAILKIRRYASHRFTWIISCSERYRRHEYIRML
jgi:hypothetical protein